MTHCKSPHTHHTPYQSINHSVSQSVKQPTNQPTDQSINQSINQSIIHSFIHSFSGRGSVLNPLGELTALPRLPSLWGKRLSAQAHTLRTPPRSRASASIFGPSFLPQWKILDPPLKIGRLIFANC